MSRKQRERPAAAAAAATALEQPSPRAAPGVFLFVLLLRPLSRMLLRKSSKLINSDLPFPFPPTSAAGLEIENKLSILTGRGACFPLPPPPLRARPTKLRFKNKKFLKKESVLRLFFKRVFEFRLNPLFFFTIQSREEKETRRKRNPCNDASAV